jgi:dihydrofolate reductase
MLHFRAIYADFQPGRARWTDRAKTEVSSRKAVAAAGRLLWKMPGEKVAWSESGSRAWLRGRRMWDELKRQRFQELRGRESALTETERSELAGLAKELEAAEAAYLAPATERLRRQRQTLETRNRALEVLARRKEALLQRLREFLGEARTERRAIERELDAVLAEERRPETEG